MERALEFLVLGGAGSAAVCALGLGLRGLSRTDAVLRYRLMAACLGALWVLAPSGLAATMLAPEWARGALSPLRAGGGGRGAPDLGREGEGAAWPAGGAPGAAAGAAEGAGRGLDPARMVLALYGTGVVAGLALLGARLLGAVRVVRGAGAVGEARVLAVWGALCRAGAGVRLLESGAVGAPSSWGFWRPAVILPRGAGEWDEATLACALRHELVHVARRDAVVCLLMRLALAVFWFNPLAHVFSRCLEEDCEASCDARVVRVTGGARRYALALLECCRRPGDGPPVRLFLAPFWSSARRGRLERRLRMIPDAIVPVSSRRSLVVALAGAAALTAVLGAHAASAAALSPRRPAAVQPGGPARPGAITVKTLKEREGRVVEAEVRGVGGKRDWARLLEMLEQQSPGRLPDSVTEQETLASFQETGKVGARLEVKDLNLNLPEGSTMRAVFEGRAVRTEVAGAETRITVEAGTARLMDGDGVARVTVRPAKEGATLVWVAKRANEEVNLTVRDERAGEAATLLEMDLDKGVPPGEKQPPHGSVRFAFFPASKEENKVSRVKIQWPLEVRRLKEEQSKGQK